MASGTMVPRSVAPQAQDAAPVSAQDARQGGPRPAGLAGVNRYRFLGLLGAVAVLALVLWLSLVVGSKDVDMAKLWPAITAYDGSPEHVIIHDLRLPRTVTGVVVGIALGLSGALIQALTRNPLADPGILGVNAGAGFFVVLGVALFGVTSIQDYIWFSFAGAVVATVAVYFIGSRGRGGATPLRLTLAGVALGAVLGGISSGITLLRPAVFDSMRSWSAGTLNNRTWEIFTTVASFILVGTLIALAMARPLNAVAMGDDTARSLGANIVRTRIWTIVSVTLLCGAATAAAGPIGFVGLMVPHVARWIVGPDQRWILAYTLVLSPVLLLVSDILGRLVLRPGEMQVGIITAFVGAPVLIWLIRRRKVSTL
ncbi:Fe(3+)-siderophore ABC transporter permease [Paenarthrobacter sp. A20]|uniref:Fe(3+)-siderophore ABC transporter permease n=1 Tax=Paenarthrobacter sp. A20 TaxID=2817891 RepID=UPI00209D3762|nr:Fe(3+)-siderophore ABC transporter permease [Paenarthrobacter sp. A20]MCP1412064.1 iron complex transport system permease protein [Paenarthrobacter sp. A20]